MDARWRRSSRVEEGSEGWMILIQEEMKEESLSVPISTDFVRAWQINEGRKDSGWLWHRSIRIVVALFTFSKFYVHYKSMFYKVLNQIMSVAYWHAHKKIKSYFSSMNIPQRHCFKKRVKLYKHSAFIISSENKKKYMPLPGIDPEPFRQPAQCLTTKSTIKHWKSGAKTLIDHRDDIEPLVYWKTPQALSWNGDLIYSPNV